MVPVPVHVLARVSVLVVGTLLVVESAFATFSAMMDENRKERKKRMTRQSIDDDTKIIKYSDEICWNDFTPC